MGSEKKPEGEIISDFKKSLDVILEEENKVILDINDKFGVKMVRRDIVNEKQKKFFENYYSSIEENIPYADLESYREFISPFHGLRKNSYIVQDNHIIGIFITRSTNYYIPMKQEIPENLGNLSELESLSIMNTQIKKLPDFIEKLKKLRYLKLSGNHNLMSIPDCFEKLKNLRYLKIYAIRNLISLPDSLGELSQLEELDLRSNINLESLPESIGNLSNLKKIIIRGHQKLISLPDSLGELSQLEELDLRSNNNLTSLPISIGNLSNLKKLIIRGEFSSFPDSIGDLSELEELDLGHSNKLVSLPNSIGNLSNLKKVIIKLSPRLIFLPDSLGDLSGLENLDIISNYSLTSLPENIGNLSNLKILKISKNPNIFSLPDSLGELSGLEELELKSNINLKSLPKNIGNLSNLKILKICGNKLVMLPETFRILKLERFEMKENSLRNLTNINFNSLSTYEISITNLTEKAKNILDPHISDDGGIITECIRDDFMIRDMGVISAYYEKSTYKLAKQYCDSQISLTNEELDRIIWEASSKEREMLESAFPVDNEIIKKINDRLSVHLKNDSEIIL